MEESGLLEAGGGQWASVPPGLGSGNQLMPPLAPPRSGSQSEESRHCTAIIAWLSGRWIKKELIDFIK